MAIKKHTDSVVIVTGGASGIGKEICLYLARNGAIVIIADINFEAAKTVENIIGSMGGQGKAKKVNVSNTGEVEELITETIGHHKKIGMMINNAGIGINGEFQDMNLELWRKIMDVNFWGVVYGTYYVYPIMMKQGFGQIVNVSSLAGLIPAGLMTSYVASKHAVVGFTLGLRSEAMQYGIKVNALCPGFIETPIHDASPNVSGFLNSEKNKRPANKYPTASACINEIMRGIEKDKAIIIAPYKHKFYWWLYRIFPSMIVIMWKKIIAYLK
jgi:short-subunit dehydrogenase